MCKLVFVSTLAVCCGTFSIGVLSWTVIRTPPLDLFAIIYMVDRFSVHAIVWYFDTVFRGKPGFCDDGNVSVVVTDERNSCKQFCF